MRKLLIVLFIPAISAALYSCNKSEDPGDLGNKSIGGKVYLKNSYIGEIQKPLSGQKILLIKNKDAGIQTFERSTVSDKDGAFVFQSVLEDHEYRIYAEREGTPPKDSAVWYKATLNTKEKENIELILEPDFDKQNALYLTCLDTASNPGPVGNATVYIYTSVILANLDSAAMNGVGHAYKLSTRADGTAFRVNLPVVQLYANAYFETATGRLKARSIPLPLLNPAGLKTGTLILRK